MIQSIIDTVLDLNEKKLIELVKFHLSQGVKPIDIISNIQAGMIKVGDLYHAEKFFLADLIMAGIIFKEVLKLDEMHTSNNNEIISSEKKPVIIVATVKDDLHDIGKELFIGIMKASNYHTIDLGVDVHPDILLDTFYKYKPDIIAMSGILTKSIQNMQSVVNLFISKGQRENVKIIVGGFPVTKEACKYIGADAFSKDINEGLNICNQWISEKK